MKKPIPSKTTPNQSSSLTPAIPEKPPLIFISHDSRDESLAGAFSKLLRRASAGALKSFRSSDHKGTQGIEFGDEWYDTLMDQLGRATEVVCLLTERSLDRPWILYEAGVAKGQVNRRVHGLVVGLPMNVASKGPFYQFHNCELRVDAVTKLVLQLLTHVPAADPDIDTVTMLVTDFVESADGYLKSAASDQGIADRPSTDSPSTASLLEELKQAIQDLPNRVRKGEGLDSDIASRESVFRAQVADIAGVVERLQKNESFRNIFHLRIQQLTDSIVGHLDQVPKESTAASRLLRLLAVLKNCEREFMRFLSTSPRTL